MGRPICECTSSRRPILKLTEIAMHEAEALSAIIAQAKGALEKKAA